MKARSSGALLAAMAVVALAATALATDYIVGGRQDQWDTYVDYDKWAAGKVFMVGDSLTFLYEPYHTVLEVTGADYASCNTGSPISTHSGGNTTFPLTATGTRYFICGIPRHCLNGTMHVKVTAVPYDAKAAAAAAAANAAASPAPAPAGQQSPPADALAPAPEGYKAAAGKAPAGAPSKAAPRCQQQPARTVAAGLALAALVALAA